MTIAKEVVYALHKRIKDLSLDATPDKVAYLAKALESIAGQSTVYDIVQMTDEKLKELLDSTTNHLKSLNDSKTNALRAITDLKEQSLKKIDDQEIKSLSLLDTRKNTNIAAINSTGKEQLSSLTGLVSDFKIINDVPSSSSIMKEVKNRNMIEPGALPFVFGVLSRYQDVSWGSETNKDGWFKTELGKWNNDTANTDYMLRLLAGSNTYEYEYSSFYQPPQLYFLQGSSGKFIYRKVFIRPNFWSSIEHYPYALIGVIFVKNTTSSDLTRTFDFSVTSYWSSGYEGAGLFIGIPNNTNANKTSISDISWSNIWYNANSNVSLNASKSITIPANKTVAIMLYASAYYNYNHNGHTNYLMKWCVKNFRSSFLTKGLEVDVERTLRAWQCPGLEKTHQIWN